MYKIRIASRHPSHKAILTIGQMPKFPVRVRVRFGSTKSHRRCAIDFNPISAIENTANKVKMKRLFNQHGVKSPKFFTNNESGKNAIEEGHLGDKIFFKTPFHSRGRGMVVYDTKEEALTQQKDGYFEEACISKREFRVHVMDGVAFHIDEKRPKDSSMKMKDRPVIKNMDSGFKFRKPIKDVPEEVFTESIKAVEALGLDFGAADVGLNNDGAWIYEVNTAPSMRTKTRKLYQKALVALIWKKILGEKKYRVWVNDTCANESPTTKQEAEELYNRHDLGMGDCRIVDEVERKSAKYNKWLDEQPITD